MSASDDRFSSTRPISEGISTLSTQPEPIEAKPKTESRSSVYWRRGLEVGLVAAVLLLAFEVALFPVRNSDLLLHRAVGRSISHGEFDFHSDPFTFTTDGVRWVNHSWLFGLFVYGMHRLGEWGDPALVVMKALLIAALAELLIRASHRKKRSLLIPAFIVGLAILVLSPGAVLQPICISFLFLGLTLYLLDWPRRAAMSGTMAPSFKARWFIPILCVLWVNLDAWFLLGPATVGLYLLGELMEGTSRTPGSVANLAKVFAVSIVACLISPYHIFSITTLPDQLGLSPAGHELERIGPFKYLFQSPLRGEWFDLPIHRSTAGLLYYLLLIASVVSFALLPGSLWNWRAPVWLGFTILSIANGRTVPFWAIVAAPITALNFGDFFALREQRALDSPAPARGYLMYRVLALVVAIAAVSLGLAGLLHVPLWNTAQVGESRRPGWWLDLDPALQHSAEEIGRWRKEKLVPENAHWLNLSPEALGYLAWYAPGARGFIDGRLSLYPARAARDYKTAKAVIDRYSDSKRDAKVEISDAGELERVLSAQEILFVMAGDSSGRGIPTILPLMTRTNDWTICQRFGAAAVFGWNGRTGENLEAFRPIRYNPRRLAFGPDATTAPRARPKDLADLEWWTLFWQPEAKRSAELDEARVQMSAFQIQSTRFTQRDMTAAFAGLVGSAGWGVGPIANGTVHRLRFSFRALGDRQLALEEVFNSMRDLGPPADMYLAIRAARRAVAANPEDSRAWLALGQAYHFLSRATRERSPGYTTPALREIRQMQVVGALTQSVRFDPDQLEAQQMLTEIYQRSRYLDLTLACREAMLKTLTAKGENTEAIEADVQKLRKLLKEQQDQFELNAANKPPPQRAQVALQLGLVETAIKVLLDSLQQTRDGGADRAALAPSLNMAVQLLLATGQVDAAERLATNDLQSSSPLLGRIPDPNLPVQPDAAGKWYLVMIGAVTGNYAEVDKLLEELVSRTAQVPFGPDGASENVAVIPASSFGAFLLSNSNFGTGFAGLMQRIIGLGPGAIPSLPQALQLTAELLGRQADLQALRGHMALESGDIPAARTELRSALTRAGRSSGLAINFRARAMSEMLYEWIETSGR